MAWFSLTSIRQWLAPVRAPSLEHPVAAARTITTVEGLRALRTDSGNRNLLAVAGTVVGALPAVTSAMAEEIVRWGPGAVRAAFARPDCTIVIAAALVRALHGVDADPAHEAPTGRWSPVLRWKVLTELGARGWSLRTVDPESWDRLILEIRRGSTRAFERTALWQVLQSVPDVPSAVWSSCAGAGGPVGTGAAVLATLFALLDDPRLALDDRTQIVSHWARSYTINWRAEVRTTPWTHWPRETLARPGVLAGILGAGILKPGSGAVSPDDLARSILELLVGATPEERARIWGAVTTAPLAVRDTICRALVREIPETLATWDDALPALLLAAPAETRLWAITHLVPRPSTSEVPSPPSEGKPRSWRDRWVARRSRA